MTSSLIIKSIAIITLLLIVFSMASALYSLIKDHGQTDRTVKALTIRIGLSIALLAFILISGSLGLITPNPAP